MCTSSLHRSGPFRKKNVVYGDLVNPEATLVEVFELAVLRGRSGGDMLRVDAVIGVIIFVHSAIAFDCPLGGYDFFCVGEVSHIDLVQTEPLDEEDTFRLLADGVVTDLCHELARGVGTKTAEIDLRTH